MAVTKPPQFEPAAQIEKTCDEFADSLAAARAAVDRVLFLKDKLLADLRALQEQADAFEIYTEQEAAAMLKLDDDPRKARRRMYELRKQYELPHCSLGRDVRYTKQHLIEICEILAVNPKRRQTPAHAPRLERAA